MEQERFWRQSQALAREIIRDYCPRYQAGRWRRRPEAAVLSAAENQRFLYRAAQEFDHGQRLSNPSYQVQLAADICELLPRFAGRISAEGYFRFRLSAWRPRLERALERTWALWEEESDYAVFLRLVRLRLTTAPGKARVLHLLGDGEKLLLYDGAGREFDAAPREAEWKRNERLGMDHSETLLILLLEYRPELVFFHSAAGSAPLQLHFLADILGERLRLCGGCDLCRFAHEQGTDAKTDRDRL